MTGTWWGLRMTAFGLPGVRGHTLITAISASAFLMGSAAGSAAQMSCRVANGSRTLPGLPEASGMAVSMRSPGVLWSHNDSGEPMIYAISASGSVRGIRVTGARSGDWEASSVGKCPGGSCVYIGDIGDNDGSRPAITFYRFAEPAADAAATAAVETMQATYPDRPQDAEAMFVMPDGAMFVVTKGEQAPVGVYRVPSGFQNGTTVQLARVATVQVTEGKDGNGVPNLDKVTGASASPDGRWVVLRTRGAVIFYAAADFTAGRIQETYRFNLGTAAEPQGEGIGFGTGGVLWLASEGGGKSRPGVLTRAECTLP